MSDMHLRFGHLYGRPLRRRAADWFALSDSRYDAGFRTNEHSHEAALFVSVLDGSCREVIRGAETDLMRGIHRFYPASQSHKNIVGPAGWRTFHIELAPMRLRELADAGYELRQPCDIESGPVTLLMRQLYGEFVLGPAASTMILEGLVMAIVGELARFEGGPGSTAPPWLRIVRRTIDQRFREPLTHELLASVAGVHPVHLAKSFKRTYGTTPGHRIRQLRVTDAMERLEKTDEPICHIALEVGYSNQSHFTTAFRQVTGQTPAAVRRQAQQKTR